MAIIFSEYADSNKINVFRVVKMLLVHDLIEIDAGDTFCYDESARKNQHNREVKAANRLFKILPPDQAKKAFEDDEEVLNTGKFIINKIERITNKDGTDRWLVVTKIPRFDTEGNIIGTMGISRDITEWKRLENLYKKEIPQ